jgi:glycosyltransferase involved in cell wall biosynthesis
MSIVERPQAHMFRTAIARTLTPKVSRRLRVLLISHTCQSSTEGQPKAQALAQLADIDLKVLSPDRWFHYGQWRGAEAPLPESRFQFEAGKVRTPWVGPAKFYLHHYPRLRQVLQEFRPDVIDLWEEPWGLVSAHTCWLRNRFLPQARIISETEQNINKKLPLPFESFRTYTLKNADWAVARNSEAIQVIRDKGYTGRSEVVPNGVDAAMFQPLDRDQCQRAMGLSGFVVGYVGRLVEEKGLSDLVAAIPHCPKQVQLALVGSGELQPHLERQVAELGLGSRVRFMGGQLLQSLPRLMNAFNVLALPSRTTPQWKEQFGRVIIEAHACAVPVIGSDSGAIPDVIGDGGRIAPERNPSAFAAAICELQAHPSLAAHLGRTGRQQVERKFTWKIVAERMAGIYRTVVTQPVSGMSEVGIDAGVVVA